jgi:serine protease Do
MATPRKATLLATAGATLAAVGAWAASPYLPQPPSAPHGDSRPIAARPAAWDGGHSIADIVEQVEPAVVTITVDEAAQPVGLRGNPFGQDDDAVPGGPIGDMLSQLFGGGMHPMPQERGKALGSGFLIDDNGDILTNQHVVDGGAHFTVEFSDKSIAEATLVGTDPETDLALIHVDKHPALTPLQFADSDHLRVGDPVIAIGDPYGVGQTVTSGVISARGRSLGNSSYVDYLQTDAPINEGNSGGPLLDYSGQVVGVNSAIFSPSGGNVGIGFAIPSNTAHEVVQQLKSGGKVTRAWLGAGVQDVTPQIAAAAGLDKAEGAIISQIDPNGPSAGKLKPGDIVLGFNDTPINEARDLSMAASHGKIGSEAELHIIRQGTRETIPIKLGRLAARGDRNAAAQPGTSGDSAPKLGVTVTPLDPDSRQQLGLSDAVNGVLVTGTDPDGAGARAGLAAGDVIEQAGGVQVSDGRSLAAALGKVRNDTALLLVDRNGQRTFLAVPLG